MLLWPVPVFGVLHAESSAVLAGVGCVVAALTSAGAFGRGEGLRAVARVQLGALAVPLGLMTASLAWRPNCGYLQGLGLFLTLAPPSVLFGLGAAWAVTGWRVRWPRATLAVGLAAVAVGGTLWSLLLHPQLFVYNPVFGGVLGPIYDQELALRPGLWASAARTVLWAVALVALGAWRRTGDRRAARLGIVTALALAASVAGAGRLGIVQTRGGLQRELSARVDLGDVVLHLDPETSPAERRRLAQEALYRFETLAEALGVRPPVPVDVYLYPDAETKAALIGSRETSVVPVWLPTPQVHMLADQVPASLGHEMVHVLAREFGAPVVRASPAVGLVEGLAVALEPADGLPSPAAQVRAGLALADAGVPADAGGVPDPAAAVRATMSPGGFWTSRAGLAYTANGAFARWLLDTRGAAPLRRAYRSGRFGPAYGASLAALADEWAAGLARQPVDPEAVAVARWRFSRPSLFEVRCPHHVPAAVRLAREGREAWEDGHPATAAAGFEAAVRRDPFRLDALRGRVQARLALGARVGADDLRLARALADSLPEPGALGHLADLRRLTTGRGGALYRAASDSLAPVDALGRLLLDRRARMDRGVLRAWLAAPPETVPDVVRRRAPVVAALADAQADRPGPAWAVARTWCTARLGGTPEQARVLRWLQARIAARAGATAAAAGLLAGLADAFERGGPRSYAPLVRDDERRLRWQTRTAVRRPAIFTVPPPRLDDLAPDCPRARTAAGGGRRAARLRPPGRRAGGR